MNQLDALLAARAHAQGRAIRRASMRHRRLLENPIVLIPWQLGGEPFAASAVGFGDRLDHLRLVVAGEPRNRDLAFAALDRLAGWFLPRFEAPAAHRAPEQRGKWQIEVSLDLPQVVVPNPQAVDFIGRLGRRLAYLPADGDRPAPQAIIRLGQHFQFLARHAAQPGQQLIVPLSRLLADHWVTPQSEVERASLSALDAFIDPPGGLSGFRAVLEAELHPVGPTPTGADDERLERLVDAFNEARGGRTDRAIVDPLLGPIEAHYETLARFAWDLAWRCLHREAGYPEAASVQRRWDEDRREYTRHLDWLAQSGRRRTRQTARQAIMTMRQLEDAKARLTSEEALDDPLRMIPYLLDGKAIEGRVVSEDPQYREVASVRTVLRPLVTILADTDRPLPRGKRLFWTCEPNGPEWEVHATKPAPGGGWLVTMKLTTGSEHDRPGLGDVACFSIHGFRRAFFKDLSSDPPWPIVPSVKIDGPLPIEDGVAS